MSAIAKLLDEMEHANPPLTHKNKTLQRNEYLITPGMIEHNLYHIESGAVRVFYLTEYEEHTIRFGYTNSIITSLSSFITGQPSELYIQAIKQTKIKVILKEDYQSFIEATPHRMKLYQKILEEMMVQQMEREIDILTYSPTERYNRVLKRSPQLFQEIPSKYIASYLRMTPETLSRLKKS